MLHRFDLQLSDSLYQPGQPPGEQDRLVEEIVGQQALAVLIELADVAHPQSLSWYPIQMLDTMSRTHDIIYCPLTFGYTNYARPGSGPNLIRFRDIPGVHGALLGGAGIAVSARTEHPAEAAAYAAWISGAEVQTTLYLDHSGQPGNRLAWEDERANHLTSSFFRDTLATLQAAYVRPRHPGWPLFQEQAGERIHTMPAGSRDAKACLNDLSALFESTYLD